MTENLRVILWGQEVGRLSWSNQKQLAYFEYNPEFLSKNTDIAPLTASIHNLRSRRPIFGETERIYQGLPAFIADSLPDAWGNMLFEQWRKEKKLSAGKVTPLEKLAFIGRRGMGALEFLPEISRNDRNAEIDIKELYELSEKILNERDKIRILPDETLTLQSLISIGTSAGGRQPKGIIAINHKSGEIRSGQVLSYDDFEAFIIKFGDKLRTTAEIEYTYYIMATKAGINMMPSSMIEIEGIRHFLSKRFDRLNNEKLHTQTLAAISPGRSSSYEDLMSVCRDLKLPETDVEEVFRRMVFNILSNNTDDHNKNFSFIMDRSGRWRLSPAYDLTFIFDTGGYLANASHCLSVSGKFFDIGLEDVCDFAEKQGIRNYKNVIKEVAEVIKSFRSTAEQNFVNPEMLGHIESSLNQNLMAWGLRHAENSISFHIDGKVIENLRIESTYKGNFHLLADVDGKKVRYVIRKKTPMHQMIANIGISNLTTEQLKALVNNFSDTKTVSKPVYKPIRKLF